MKNKFFRIWDSLDKKMMYDYSDSMDIIYNDMTTLNDFDKKKRYVVMIGTCIKDINDKYIFEGDILDSSWCFLSYGIVKYGSFEILQPNNQFSNYRNCGFYYKDNLNEKGVRNDLIFYLNNMSFCVGNVFENSNLLNTGKE